MKPYHKILRPIEIQKWNGSHLWQIGICTNKNKPKIPLVYFSKIESNPEERNRWLKINLKVVDE